MRRTWTTVLVVVVSATSWASQVRVARYDMGPPAALGVNANLRITKVMGEIGTLMLGDFTAGWKNTPHHHTHEQINVGISGAFAIVTTAGPHDVSRRRGLFLPPDVQHGNDVSGRTINPILLEFQPVRRLDFPPERQDVAFPRASAPTPAPAGIELDFTPESSTWVRLPNGARVSARKGNRAAVSAWDLAAGLTEPTDLRGQLADAERFLYVAEGSADAHVGGERHAASAGTALVVSPDAPPIQIRATGAGAALVLVFEAAKTP
jgi:hypothetical protein